MTHGQNPFPDALGGVAAGRPSPAVGPWWPCRWRVHHTGLASMGKRRSRRLSRGAAGNRTRVPRPRCSGLYVRRSWMCSDRGAPEPSSSADLTAFRCSPQPGGVGLGVEPRDVDPTLVRGVRGGSSRSLCRECHLIVGNYRFRRILSRSRRHPRHAPLAAERSRSRPCQPQVWVCASALCSCQGRVGSLSTSRPDPG